MPNKYFDVLVVGSGPGGQSAAITAAKLGKSVGLIERKPYLGGVSLQTGTIPSKALREAAYLASRFSAQGMREDSARQIIKESFLVQTFTLKERIIKQQESALLSRLLKHGISIIPGEACFENSHTLAVKNRAGVTEYIKAEIIILATGSRPRRPGEIPFDKSRVLDSSSILKLKKLPERLIVIGGGVIACEFATLFAPLGVKVSIIDSHQQLLAYLDQDIISNLTEQMQQMGIRVHLQTRVTSITATDDQVNVITDQEQQLTADVVLYALGRQPNYDNLSIDRANLVNDDNGWIPINEHHQTSEKHIYIIGDLAGSPALASTAMHQGQWVTEFALHNRLNTPNKVLPMAIYTIPELSYAGETEQQLQQRQADYIVGKVSYSETARGMIIGDQQGLLKLLVEKSSRRLLGVHIIGESASELVHVGQMALNASATVDSLARNVFNYPTLAECYKTAAQNVIDQLEQGN
jgi:NAD(P) transhydrogenase